MRFALAVSVAAALVLAGCAPAGPTPGGASGSPTPATRRPASPVPTVADATGVPGAPTGSPGQLTCPAKAAAMSLPEQVGQLLMVGVAGGLDAAEATAIREHRVGSVVLLGDQSGGVRATLARTGEIAELNPDAAILVAADQEGGKVQRLTGTSFTPIPSAARQARLSDRQLRAAAAGWGAELARAGVLLNLAPVADVVPRAKTGTNEPIGKLQRGYGADPGQVSAKTAAMIAGLGDAGVAATVKHFPGLGEVVGNTDHTASVVDRVTRASSPSLQPFRDAVAAGVDAVMVSSATYQRIDPKRQAVFSPKVLGLLRGWGFDGVVISDDLGAAVSVGGVSPGKRAASFLAAGGDLVINANPALTSAMAGALRDRAEQDPAFAERVVASVGRVLTLKSRVGLVNCG